jgi:hypothetical protein
MALQYRRVTGNPSRRAVYENAILQSKINRLPYTLQAKQQKETLQRDAAFQQKQLALAKQQAAQRKREQQAMFGLEASKLGLGLAMSDMGQKTLGDVTSGVKGIFGSKEPTPAVTAPAAPAKPKTSGIVSSLPIGTAVSSGLMGFGIGKLMGDKKKTKRAMFGAGAGALMGMLSAPKGSGLLGGFTGGLFGGIGGLL